MKINPKKRMTKLIGLGCMIILPVVFGFAYLFANINMPDALSIFLIVLIATAASLLYYFLFVFFEKRAITKRQDTDDPFARG